MMLLDLHTHSIASGHATTDTIADMAKQAAKKGLVLLGITDHGPSTPLAGTISYFRSLTLAPREREGIKISYGVEANILDNAGTLDLDNHLLSSLDYAIASLHLPTKKPGSLDENTTAYIQAMHNPHVKIIGHCDDVRYPVNFRALVSAAKKHHVLLELNNASLAPDSYRGDTHHNNMQLLQCCKEMNHPVLLSSDSHGCAHVGDFAYALKLIQESNFPQELIVNYDVNLWKNFALFKKPVSTAHTEKHSAPLSVSTVFSLD